MNSRGFTMIELILSIGITTIVLGAAVLAIGLASRSLSAVAQVPTTRDAAHAMEQMVADLSMAHAFLERTATSVECTLPDRDDDGVDERVRYEWSGTPGDPVLYTFNGSQPAILISSVEAIDFKYIWQSVAGTSQWATSAAVDPGSLRLTILMIIRDMEDLRDTESALISLFESWDHTVVLMGEETPSEQFDGIEELVDVVVISGAVRDDRLNDTFRLKEVGVVVMNWLFADELGLASEEGNVRNDDSTRILNANHYTTYPFQTGTVKLATNDQSMVYFDTQTLADAIILSTTSGFPSMAILRPGTPLMDGDDVSADLAPATRVFLPYAKENLKINELTEDGLVLIKRAVEWAATGIDPPPAPITGEVLQAHLDDPLSSNSNDSIDPDDWVGTSITPVLPPTTTAWRLTGFRFFAQRDGSADGLLRIQVHRADLNGLPTGPPLAVAELLEYKLPEDEPGWVEVPLGMVESLAQHERVCVLIGTLGENGAAKVFHDGNGGELTPAYTLFDGSTGDWDIEVDCDLIFEAWGVSEEGSF